MMYLSGMLTMLLLPAALCTSVVASETPIAVQGTPLELKKSEIPGLKVFAPDGEVVDDKARMQLEIVAQEVVNFVKQRERR